MLALAFSAALIARSGARVVGVLRTSHDSTLEDDSDLVSLGILAERKEMILQLITSTNLDHATSKISTEDRDRTLAQLKREGVGILRDIDALGGEPADLEAVDRALLELGEAGDGVNAPSVADWSLAARIRHASPGREDPS